jgi:hypothetical protein
MRIPVIGVFDIKQTTWRQFGCFVAMPEHLWFRDVTERHQRRFVPVELHFISAKWQLPLLSWV